MVGPWKVTGPLGYVLKPYADRELEAAIEVSLHRGQMEDSLRQSHEQLEHQVAERTNELAASNEQLRQEIAEREKAQQALEAQSRLLMAFCDMAHVITSTLDPDQVLDSLAQQIVGAGVFRSLMVAMVDHESRHVEVVRNYLSLRDGAEGGDLSPDERLEAGGLLTPTPAYVKPEHTATHNERIVGTRYSLDDDNVTAVAARTGEMMVIDGWDDRLDERITFRGDVSRNISYFLPVKHGDRVVAVLATGSCAGHKADTLRRVEAMQPLLNQVAIAMEHARLYEQVHQGHLQLQALSQKLQEVQEEERRHLSRELHDQIGQDLTGLKILLEIAQGTGSGAAKNPHVLQAQELANQLMRRVSGLSLDLRPPVLAELGLLPALQWHFRQYGEQTRVQVDFTHRGLEKRLDENAEMGIYRIVQEALNNVARHAGTDEVEVSVCLDHDMILIQVEDHGKGFDPEAAMKAGATSGLVGMRERAASLGGSLRVDSELGKGTRIHADIPLGQHEPR